MEENNAYLRAQVDFLFRRLNGRAMSREERIQWLERNDFKPNYTFFTLWCGCRRYRDDSLSPCARHLTAAAPHAVLDNGRTLHAMATAAEAADGRF